LFRVAEVGHTCDLASARDGRHVDRLRPPWRTIPPHIERLILHGPGVLAPLACCVSSRTDLTEITRSTFHNHHRPSLIAQTRPVVVVDQWFHSRPSRRRSSASFSTAMDPYTRVSLHPLGGAGLRQLLMYLLCTSREPPNRLYIHIYICSISPLRCFLRVVSHMLRMSKSCQPDSRPHASS